MATLSRTRRGGPMVALERLLLHLHPGARILAIEPLGGGAATTAGATEKAAGYGRPLRILLQLRGGARRELVFRTASANEFGHDRRSDRAQQMLLAYDTFGQIPRHVRALDVGAIGKQELFSLRQAGEFYLLTTYARGQVYAGDLERIRRTAVLGPNDLVRCETLADYLAELHSVRASGAAVYRRSIRDLLGHGEGIFGIVDGYPDRVAGASAARLRRIEQLAHDWRWRLRRREDRLRRIHGDFHPFNLLFEGAHELAVLDASRGSKGDPADDLTALSLNYVFFALDAPKTWRSAFGPLWKRFWSRYLAATGDAEVKEVLAPFLAWRALVLACPRWYPSLPAASRNKLLGLAEWALEARAFSPAWAEELFA